jgi:hypothetical protein
LTDAQRKLLEHSANIFGDLATKKDAAYLPRELVQVTMPHKNPGDVQQWKRTNGNLTVGIQPGQNFTTGESYGYPYGPLPRLLLFWITTEAIKKKSRRIWSRRRRASLRLAPVPPFELFRPRLVMKLLRL